jgi:hypothetical protein
MSKNREPAEFTIHASSPNSTIMVFAKVGDGPCWTTANSSNKLQVRSCGRRLLHQMGCSEGFGEHHGTNNSEILLEKHSLRIRGSKRSDPG